MTYSMHIDDARRRPPALSRRDALRLSYRLRERSAGHLDADDRTDLLVQVDDAVDARGMLRSHAHRACGLPDGALDDASLSTDALRAALDVLRGLPVP